MSNKGVTGELRQTCTDISLEWKITNFSTLSEELGDCYTSSDVLFNDSAWYLTVYPNGEKDHESEGWIGLYIMRRRLQPPRTVSYKLGVRKNNGEEEKPLVATDSFDDKYSGWGRAKYLLKSELTKRKSEFLTEDTLTITCTLKTDFSCLVGATLPGRLLDVSRNLKDILVTHKGSDVILKANDRDFKAHKIILETRSAVFAAMFSHDMIENRTGVVTIADTEPDVLENVLSYMYYGEVEKISDDNVCQLYTAADKYDLKNLKEMCTNFIEQNMSVDIVCDVLLIADL